MWPIYLILAASASFVNAIAVERLQRRTVQTSATCTSDFSWMDNSQNSSPCQVAAQINAICNNGNRIIPALDASISYTNPSPALGTASLCTCSWASYNLISACTACQNTEFESKIPVWTDYISQCSGFLSNGFLPSNITLTTSLTIPVWAGKDPTTWTNGRFNVVAAQTLANRNHPDLSQRTTTSKKSNRVGAIVGGVSGGLVVIGIAIVATRYIPRQQKKPVHPHVMLPLSRASRHMRSVSDVSGISGRAYTTLSTAPLNLPLGPTSMTRNASVLSAPYTIAASTVPYTTASSPPPRQTDTASPPLQAPQNPADIITPFVDPPSSTANHDRKQSNSTGYPIYEDPNAPPPGGARMEIIRPSTPGQSSSRGKYLPPTYSEWTVAARAVGHRGKQESTDTVQSITSSRAHGGRPTHEHSPNASASGMANIVGQMAPGSNDHSCGPSVSASGSGVTSNIPVQDDNDGEFDAITCWIAAEKALLHVRSKASEFADAFLRQNIPPSEYAVHAGFDESLIRAGMGYLEQIHIFASEKVDPVSDLLSELEGICFPFSCILFMELTSYVVALPNGIPPNRGEIPPPTVISLAAQTPGTIGGPSGFAQHSSGNGEEGGNKKRRSEKGKERDDGDGDEPDEEDENDKGPPEPSGHGSDSARNPSISFAVNSKIKFTLDGRDVIQALTMRGDLTIKTTSLVGHKNHERRIQFDALRFGTEEEEMPYKQSYVKVIVNAHAKTAHPKNIKPKATSAHGRTTNQTLTTTETQGPKASAGLSAGINTQGALHLSYAGTHAVAQGTAVQQNTSRITQKDMLGVITWGLDIDDPNEQNAGIQMNSDTLPGVDFLFVAPTLLPKRTDIEITSCWSMIADSPSPRAALKWPNNLFKWFKSADKTITPPYSNLCQITSLETYPATLEPLSLYVANMDAIREITGDFTVSAPDVLQRPDPSVVVTPTIESYSKQDKGIDNINLNISSNSNKGITSKLPSITKVKLPDKPEQVLENMGSSRGKSH